MEKSVTPVLNDLIAVLFNNLIYYVPSEIIIDVVFEQIEEELPDNYFDHLNLFVLENGISQINDEDVLEISQRLLNKRLQLEENIFKLESKSKEMLPIVFEIIIQKYYNQLLFFLFISDWLIANLKKYNKGNIHLGIIGAFKNQYEYLKSHLKDYLTYFGNNIDVEKEYFFTPETLVMEYIPDLLSRFNQIGSNNFVENSSETLEELVAIDTSKQHLKPILKQKVKKKRPEISDEKIDKMILESVFNIKLN